MKEVKKMNKRGFAKIYQCMNGRHLSVNKAMKEIDSSNFLIIEATSVNVTSCIELGYAKAKRKPIVYLQKAEADTNDLLFALSNFHILYSSPKDLFDQLNEFLKNVLPQN